MTYEDRELELAEMLLGVLPELKSRRLSGDNTVCERIEEIERAIESAGLTDKQRRALELVAIQGYDVEEVADADGVKRRAMYYRLEAALRKFIVAYGGIERYVV